jgi:murein L,D-transpeptidase YcbB/YkuD
LLVSLLLGATQTVLAADVDTPQGAIQGLVERPDGATELRGLYAKRSFEPLWTVKDKVTPQATTLIQALRSAEAYGLRSTDYDVDAVAALLATPTAEHVASVDVQLSALASRFLQHLHQGRADPRAAGFELQGGRPPLDLAAILTLLATTDDPSAVVGSVEPAFYHYRLLKAALKRYRQLAAQPGLSDLPRFQGTIKPGAAYAGAPTLRKLLRALGDLPSSPKAGPVLDPKLVKALKHFQERHGIEPSGRLAAATHAALTVPLTKRVRQIELTLERWRWLPPFETPPLIVNIPQFRLFAFRSTQDLQADILQMDVIVGQSYPEKQTPVFAGDMRYVIFRPYWDIPSTILENELLPHIRDNPGYLAAQHLEMVQGDLDDSALVVPPTPANIEALAAGKLRLRQQPGPDNALGLIKFMFPNSHDVYLHSTPAHQLFKESRRDFSHGCIRVSDPLALAVQVLRDTSGDWTREKIDEAMKSGPANQRVNLESPIRVLILYATALAKEDGSMFFFDDIYGHDQRLEGLLKLPPAAPPSVPTAAQGLTPASAPAPHVQAGTPGSHGGVKANARAAATPRS